MSVQEFFEQLPTKVDPAKTAGMTNSYVFDVAGRRSVDGHRGRRCRLGRGGRR